MKIIRIFVNNDGEGLHSIKYIGEDLSVWRGLFKKWSDTQYLRTYLIEKEELFNSGYYQVSLSDAITIIQDEFENLIKKIKDCANRQTGDTLQMIFKPFHDKDTSLGLYQESKISTTARNYNKSFLRIYALRIDVNTYIITGGAIKLTRAMIEDETLQKEEDRFAEVRLFLEATGIKTFDNLKYYYEE